MYRALVFPHTMYLGTSLIKLRADLLSMTYQYWYPGTPTFAFECGTSMYLGRTQVHVLWKEN